MTVRSEKERAALEDGGRILGQILQDVAARVRPGATTKELNDRAAELMKQAGAEPAFLGYHGYPAVLCTSVNDVVVHGIPSANQTVSSGDIIGLDIGIRYRGLYTDMAVTVPVGKVSVEADRLIGVAREALGRAIAYLRPGQKTGDLGAMIQQYVEGEGFGVVRDLVGHGVGRKLHEDLMVPNFGVPGQGQEFKENTVIAIEPMITAGDWHVKTLDDGWAIVTVDGSLAAHFEHTVLLTSRGAKVLTT